jgi:outer membrane lipoprotein SlyB
MTNITSKLLSVVAVVTLALTSGCARDMGSTVYTSSNAVGKVLEGTVLSARQVTIKDNDKPQDNVAGMLGGGLLGGVAGASIGKGTGQGVAAIGGALAGAALGNVVQGQLGKSQGMEYVVRLDSKYVNSTPTVTQKKQISMSDGSIDSDIKNSIAVTNTQTDLISVIQGNDVVFQAGQRVLIIYNNDRPRLAPAN